MTAQSIFRYVLILSSTADFLEKFAMAVFAVAVLVYVIGRVLQERRERPTQAPMRDLMERLQP